MRDLLFGNHSRFFWCLAQQLQWKTIIIQSCHQWEEVKTLIDHGHILAPILVQVDLVGRSTAIDYLTFSRQRQASHQGKQGGLA